MANKAALNTEFTQVEILVKESTIAELSYNKIRVVDTGSNLKISSYKTGGAGTAQGTARPLIKLVDGTAMKDGKTQSENKDAHAWILLYSVPQAVSSFTGLVENEAKQSMFVRYGGGVL